MCVFWCINKDDWSYSRPSICVKLIWRSDSSCLHPDAPTLSQDPNPGCAQTSARFIYFYVHECLTCMYLCSTCVQCRWRPEEGIRSPRAGVIEVCEQPCGHWEPNWILCKSSSKGCLPLSHLSRPHLAFWDRISHKPGLSDSWLLIPETPPFHLYSLELGWQSWASRPSFFSQVLRPNPHACTPNLTDWAISANPYYLTF